VYHWGVTEQEIVAKVTSAIASGDLARVYRLPPILGQIPKPILNSKIRTMFARQFGLAGNWQAFRREVDRYRRLTERQRLSASSREKNPHAVELGRIGGKRSAPKGTALMKKSDRVRFGRMGGLVSQELARLRRHGIGEECAHRLTRHRGDGSG